MRLQVNSAELLSTLQVLDKVILTKTNTPNIAQCVLFDISNDTLLLRATDPDIAISGTLHIIEATDNCKIAVNSKNIIEILRTIPEQPITFDINPVSMQISLNYQNGHINFQGENANDFPAFKALDGEITSISSPTKALNSAIGNAIIATSTDQARPAMTGILFDITPEEFSVVASDGRKLVRTNIKSELNGETLSFIVPPKPINVVRSILERKETTVRINTNTAGFASFETEDFTMSCRLVADPYPNYRRVIPQNNDRIAIIDRSSIVNALRRILSIVDKSTNLVKMQVDTDKITLSAENNSFGQSAEEQLVCQYEGTPIKIGFQVNYLIELISRLTTEEIKLSLSDPSRAGLIEPTTQEADCNVLMLIMPLLITY